jgi:signal transduction histidine kinase
MFRLLRYYSVASLAAVVGCAAVLIGLHRHVTTQGIVHLAERSNLNMAQAALTPIKPALLDYLQTAAQSGAARPPPLPPELARAINTVMQDKFVVRIKIFNPGGTILFSTRPDEIGRIQRRSENFLAASRGGVGSALIYRDVFNVLESSEEDNLIETYLPVRAGPADPIQGVFELYADVSGLAAQAERIQIIGIVTVVLALSALYAVLLLVVRRAGAVIEQQQRAIRERSETLEFLSAHLLRSEESDKQKIAADLHEGVAQTLAALKMELESRARKPAPAPVDALVPALQDAIQEVRAIATGLRPASLDELGLLPTLASLGRQLQQRHAHLQIEIGMEVDEEEVPMLLKVILYRIVASVLDELAHARDPRRVRIGLLIEEDRLVLSIEHRLSETTAHDGRARARGHLGLGRMEELTTLTGGQFSIARHPDGATLIRSSWPDRRPRVQDADVENSGLPQFLAP